MDTTQFSVPNASPEEFFGLKNQIAQSFQKQEVPSDPKKTGAREASGSNASANNQKGKVKGFGNRKFTRPKGITEPYQTTGTVNLKICVAATGQVISAKPSGKGSSTLNPFLQNLAIENAQKYRFSKFDEEKQCGNITYVFKLK